MLTLRTWQPVRPTLSTELATALREPDTVVLLVIGSGPDADRAERLCGGLARDPGFESLRVVRVLDRVEQRAVRRVFHLTGGCTLAVLGPDRQAAVPVARPDAVDLFVAVSAFA